MSKDATKLWTRTPSDDRDQKPFHLLEWQWEFFIKNLSGNLTKRLIRRKNGKSRMVSDQELAEYIA